MSGWLARPRGALTHGGWIVLLAFVAVGAFQVFALGRCGRSPERLPQLVRGDDALAVAFGGARETISLAMVHKADSYFHGGIDMECTLGHDHDEDRDHDHDRGEGCGCNHEHSVESNNQTIKQSNNIQDPWLWINSHIRAPEVERHLEGEKAVEMMPWLWASVKADPHNIDAWTTAWYTANNMLKDRALAARVLAEARARNPESLELLLTEARHLYDRGRGDLVAAERVFAEVRDKAFARCGGDLEKLSENDRRDCRFALDVLRSLGNR